MGSTPYCNWETKNVNMNCYIMWTIFEGLGWVQAPDQVYTVSGGDCFLLRPNAPYVLINNLHYPLKICCIHFDFYDGPNQPVYPQFSELPNLYRRIPNFLFFKPLLERVLDATIDHTNYPQAKNDLLKAVLYEICRIDAKQEQSQQVPWLEELCQTIRTHPERSYQVTRLAKNLGYSANYFRQLFKRYIGQTPSNYIIQAKLEHAKDLLLESNFSIREISELLGYSDVFYFSKQFKQKTGMSPLRFRKQ